MYDILLSKMLHLIMELTIFLVDPSAINHKLSNICKATTIQEGANNGICSLYTETILTVSAYNTGYIDQTNAGIVGLQTDELLKRTMKPFGGFKEVASLHAVANMDYKNYQHGISNPFSIGPKSFVMPSRISINLELKNKKHFFSLLIKKASNLIFISRLFLILEYRFFYFSNQILAFTNASNQGVASSWRPSG